MVTHFQNFFFFFSGGGSDRDGWGWVGGWSEEEDMSDKWCSRRLVCLMSQGRREREESKLFLRGRWWSRTRSVGLSSVSTGRTRRLVADTNVGRTEVDLRMSTGFLQYLASVRLIGWERGRGRLSGSTTTEHSHAHLISIYIYCIKNCYSYQQKDSSDHF